MNVSPASSRAPLLEGAVLLAVALACLAFQLYLPTTHVAEADYQAVAAVLEAEGQPGDVVLLAPWWTERARLYVPERLRVVGFQGSDGADLETHPRIWVLAEPGLPNSGLGAFQAAFERGRTALGPERRFGPLSLRPYANGRARPVVLDGNEALARAQVYLEQPGGGRQGCSWNGRGHQCPTGHTLAVEWHEVNFEPLLCLTMDAPGGATRLVVEYPPTAGIDTVALRAGYVWERAAYKDGVSSSDVGLEVDGQVSVLNVPAGVERPAQRLERPGGSVVRVWLTAQNPNARQLCVTVVGFGRAP